MGVLKEVLKGVLIGLLTNVAIWFIQFIAHIFGFSSLFDFMLIEVPLWVFISALIIVIPTMTFYIRSKYTSSYKVSVGHMRPPIYDFTIKYSHFGVQWKLLGKHQLSGEPYIYCEPNPYCPNCDYEMEAEKRGFILKKYFWKCHNCGNLYKCPKEHYKAHEIVEKLVESDIRRGKINVGP
jgi:ribosomal protein L37AE/L43A